MPQWASERLEPTPPLDRQPAGRRTRSSASSTASTCWRRSGSSPRSRLRTHISLANWQFLLFSFPLAFSTLFFAVPFGRWIKARIEARARRARNDRRRLLGRIFAAGKPRLREELAPTPALAAMLDRELVSLGGDVATEPDESGRVRYTFPRIAAGDRGPRPRPRRRARRRARRGRGRVLVRGLAARARSARLRLFLKKQ